jgi:hypothetical protein
MFTRHLVHLEQLHTFFVDINDERNNTIIVMSNVTMKNKSLHICYKINILRIYFYGYICIIFS